MHGAHQEVSTFPTQARFPVADPGHIVMAFFLTLLVRSRTRSGAGTCALMGLLVRWSTGRSLITFAVQPITSKILWGWNVGRFSAIRGRRAIIGVIYKSAPANITFVKNLALTDLPRLVATRLLWSIAIMKRFILAFVAAFIFISFGDGSITACC